MPPQLLNKLWIRFSNVVHRVRRIPNIVEFRNLWFAGFVLLYNQSMSVIADANGVSPIASGDSFDFCSRSIQQGVSETPSSGH
jgi:hypothetical protein